MSLLLACACSSEKAPEVDPLPPPAPGEGYQFSAHAVAAPYSELWKCIILELPTTETTPISRVKSVQSKNMHHMDLMVIASSGLQKPPGTYDCEDLYRETPKLMEEIILYAAQNEHQEVVLPEGTAAMIPAGLTLMYELHYVNTTAEEVEVFSKTNAYQMAAADVKENLWGFAQRDLHLNLEPNSESVEWTRCVMTADVDLLFATMHSHERGAKTTINLFDGTNTGRQIYENLDWANPHLESFAHEPIKVKAGEGFEFACHYKNREDRKVEWGFLAEDEMCNMAVVFTPGKASIKCNTVATSDGILQ